jgi:hypothetical protein
LIHTVARQLLRSRVNLRIRWSTVLYVSCTVAVVIPLVLGNNAITVIVHTVHLLSRVGIGARVPIIAVARQPGLPRTTTLITALLNFGPSTETIAVEVRVARDGRFPAFE